MHILFFIVWMVFNFSAVYAETSVLNNNANAEKIPTIKLEALLKSNIRSITDHEVLISRVTIQPQQKLERHTHPSEEYLYVITGETTLYLNDTTNIKLSSGQIYKIPPMTIHSASTQDKAAEIIVFRVHPKGKPIKTLAKTN